MLFLKALYEKDVLTLQSLKFWREKHVRELHHHTILSIPWVCEKQNHSFVYNEKMKIKLIICW